MTEVKSSTEHMACYYIPVVTTDVHDVESQVMQVQEPKVPTAMTAADVGDSDDDDSAGKGLGIALFCHILVGFVATRRPIVRVDRLCHRVAGMASSTPMRDAFQLSIFRSALIFLKPLNLKTLAS